MQEFEKYKLLLFLIMVSIPILIIIVETRKSSMIKKHFNFNKALKKSNPKRKIPPSYQGSDGTLIGYQHKRPITIADNAKHVFICGTTGSGKTVALSNFIAHVADKGFPALIVDGKGDMGTGSILEITKQLCRKQKIYVISISDPFQSDKYNPFRHASPTACKDMLINMTEWSEPHYKHNTERYLQRLIVLLKQNGISLSFQSIVGHMPVDQFNALSTKLFKEEVISKQEHLVNLGISNTCGKIAQEASARFSTILESEVGSIFEPDGIDIYNAIKEKAVILFILNPMLYPELSPLFGRLVLIDAKQAVNQCFRHRVERAFYIFDEINTYASPALIDLINKSRSANITAVLATQSLADLDFAVNEAFKEQIIENTNNYLVLRQNSAVNAEHWANILGTKSTIDVTYQLRQNGFDASDTGLGSARRVREFLYHPDDIKALKTGQGIFMSKDENFHSFIHINKPY